MEYAYNFFDQTKETDRSSNVYKLLCKPTNFLLDDGSCKHQELKELSCLIGQLSIKILYSYKYSQTLNKRH